MGKLSRQKGAAFEREVAIMLRGCGLDARRNVQETQLGNDGDVLVADFPLTIQAKVGQRPPVFDALDEAEAVATARGHIPLAFLRRNTGQQRRKRDAVCMRTEDFLMILRFLRERDVEFMNHYALEQLL